MKVLKCLVLFLSVLLAVATMAAPQSGSEPSPKLPGAAKPKESPKLAGSFARLPLTFEANEGQTNPKTKFISRGRGYTLFLNGDEAELSLRKPTITTSNSKRDDGNWKFEARNSALRSLHNAESLSSEFVHMRLAGASRAAKIKGLDELPGKSNYFIGNDPMKWQMNVPTYARVKYYGVYPGIDLVYYGNQQQLEYDFVVAPGADPRAIQLSLQTGNSKPETRSSKAKAVLVDPSGDLVIHAASGDVRFLKPVLYQIDSDRRAPRGGAPDQQASIANRQFVDGRYVLLAGNRVAFDVGAYDKSRPLIIDPILSYSTYLGGGGVESDTGIAVDSSGNTYVSGLTCTTDFINDPTGCDATVTKINSTGTGVIYSTVFGGSQTDEANSIAVDASGDAFVTGLTCSSDFPVTTGAFQAKLGDTCDAFVTKLNPSGQQLYSTYLGGSKGTDGFSADDDGFGIALDSSGNAYVAGQTCSSDFPTKNAFQSNFPGGFRPCDGFVTKLNPAGGGASDLLYSTFLGGSDESDAALGIAVDSSNLVYVVGQTASGNFPTTEGAFQTSFGGNFDAFITKLDMTKSGSGSLLYSSFLGGAIAEINESIALDAAGNVYVSGSTDSDNYPTTSGAYQTSKGKAAFNVFVAKLKLAGKGADDLLYSTYLGGSGNNIDGVPFSDDGFAIAVGPSGNIYLTGNTCSKDFPVTSDAFQSSLAGPTASLVGCDAFVAKLNPAGGGKSDLVYSTYFGGSGADLAAGIALDSTGNAHLTGITQSTNLPHTSDAVQTKFGGGTLDFNADAFVAAVPIGNFSITPASSITADVGGSGTSSITVSATNEFNAPVSLSISGQPEGVTASFDPGSVTPTATSASSGVSVNLGFASTPGTFSLNVTGTSGLLTHSTSAQVTVRASSSGTSTVIGGLTAAGCIDNSGISGALINKLTQAQGSIDAGRFQDAINTLSALLNQLQAQSGKHITGSCTINGQTFNPVDVLITDVRGILAALKVRSAPNPVTGYVVNGSNVGIAGAAVSIPNTANTATSDSTGFYFFADTTNLSIGTSYDPQVTGFPAGFDTSSPASQSFTWEGSTITLANFVLNKK